MAAYAASELRRLADGFVKAFGLRVTPAALSKRTEGYTAGCSFTYLLTAEVTVALPPTTERRAGEARRIQDCAVVKRRNGP